MNEGILIKKSDTPPLLVDFFELLLHPALRSFQHFPHMPWSKQQMNFCHEQSFVCSNNLFDALN